MPEFWYLTSQIASLKSALLLVPPTPSLHIATLLPALLLRALLPLLAGF